MGGAKHNFQWLEGLRQSKHTVFREIFDRYQHSVYLNIKKLVHAEEDAEDILQDVFHLLWEKRLELRQEQDIAGWLFNTSYYKSLAHLRKSIRSKLTSLSEAAAEPHPVSNSDDEYAQQLNSLYNAINLLPARKRTAFHLYRIEGKTYDEIADILNISRQSVKDYVKTSSIFVKKYVLEQQNGVGKPVAHLLLVILLS